MKKSILLLGILGGFITPVLVLAQGAGPLEYTSYTVFGLAQVSDLCQLIEGIWNLLFAFLIVAAFISIVVAGYLYSTAGVSPSNVNTAKGMLAGAIGGLLLGATSYMILNTIQPTLVTATCEIEAVDVGVTVVNPGGIGGGLGGAGLGGLPGGPTVGGYYTQGNIGPTSTGAHFDIKRSDRGDYGRTSLDQYVLVNGQPLSSGLTVPGGMYGAPRSYGGHAGYDYAFPAGATLQLTNGAEWVSSTPTSNGDLATFRTPDGQTYQILHGTYTPG